MTMNRSAESSDGGAPHDSRRLPQRSLLREWDNPSPLGESRDEPVTCAQRSASCIRGINRSVLLTKYPLGGPDEPGRLAADIRASRRADEGVRDSRAPETSR